MASQSFITPFAPLDRRSMGKFEVLCRLSTGGMSEIFLAHQSGLAGFRKVVVLKSILPDIGGEEDFVRMFLEEARTTASFTHPNIAQVYELDVDDGMLFMAMEFVQGCTLVEMARACRQAKEPIPIGFTLAAVRDTALALHYAHGFTDVRGRKQSVIHRDVAEKNIMVTYEGVTKLLDFGIAKAEGRSGRTSVGMVKGTSGYMSPEQIRGEPLDARSDIFALGVVAHECLTGLRLFHGKNPEDGMLAALKGDVAPPSRVNKEVWKELDKLVLRALAVDRDARFPTALEFAREVERISQGAIWHPEHSGELVARFFSERRQETQRALEGASFGGETTGEMRLESVIRKVRASTSQEVPRQKVDERLTAEGLRADARLPEPGPTPPVPPPPGARHSPAPFRAPPDADEATVPGRIKAPSRATDLSPSHQADSARLRGTPPPEAVAPGVVRLDPPPDWDDDESDAKTIPAAALPEELKALRDKLRRDRAPATVPATSTGGQKPINAPPSGPMPVVQGVLEPVQPAAVVSPATVPPPRRTDTGETVSITGRAAPPAGWKPSEQDWDADEPAARTQMARPSELPSGKVPPRRPTQDSDEHTSEDHRATMDYGTAGNLSSARRSTAPLIVLILVLVVAAAAAALLLLDIIPSSEPEPPAAVDGPIALPGAQPPAAEPPVPAPEVPPAAEPPAPAAVATPKPVAAPPADVAVPAEAPLAMDTPAPAATPRKKPRARGK